MHDSDVKEIKKQLEEILYSRENFIDRDDYIELIHHIGNIHMIEKCCSNEHFTWNEAIEYAKNLKIGEFEDWRIPTKEELEVIYKIKNDCGINKFDDCFWSSTCADNTECALLMNFYFGKEYYGHKSYKYYCRCVR